MSIKRLWLFLSLHSCSSKRFFISLPPSILFVFCFFNSPAQDVNVKGGFLSDSLKIGQETAFYLSARYPSHLNILFPDSTFNFSPFEYQKRKYFVTKTSNGISVDSAVYYFTTFEVDRTQFLDLPVYVIQPQDCTIYESPQDSVLITQLVSQVPDSLTADKLPLRMNTTYQKVFFDFNFWLLLIVVGALMVVAALIWIFFGKKINKYLKAKKLQKNHSQFLRTYDNIVGQVKSTFSAMTTETALSLWKKYMEQLEAHPFTKLTTSETMKLIKDDHLKNDLHTIDTAIYGYNNQVIEALERLKAFADQRFSKKLEDVMHGK